MSHGLCALVYVSQSALPVGAKQRVGFEQILAASRRNNARLAITGALLFYDEQFLQILEGPRAAVEPLFETIRGDDRHRSVRHLSTDPAPGRRFASWSMAFVNPGHVGAAFVGLSLPELRNLEGPDAEPIIGWMLHRLKREPLY